MGYTEEKAFKDLNDLLLKRKPEIALWDVSQVGNVQGELIELLREEHAKGTKIGRALTEEGFWRQWGNDSDPPGYYPQAPHVSKWGD